MLELLHSIKTKVRIKVTSKNTAMRLFKLSEIILSIKLLIVSQKSV